MRQRSTFLLHALLSALVLALASGLPRFLVLCSPDAGAPHVTLTACCHCVHGHADDHAAAPGVDERGGDAATPAAHGDCVHTLLAELLGPLPSAPFMPPAPTTVAWMPLPALAPALPPADGDALARATGPPRPDGRSARRALDVRRE
ncbi:MAG: hypothetical protein U1E73_07280 [Planctomycetota bacterium]